jgi:hypothetical protein
MSAVDSIDTLQRPSFPAEIIRGNGTNSGKRLKGRSSYSWPVPAVAPPPRVTSGAHKLGRVDLVQRLHLAQHLERVWIQGDSGEPEAADAANQGSDRDGDEVVKPTKRKSKPKPARKPLVQGMTPEEKRRLERQLDAEFAGKAEIIAAAFRQIPEQDFDKDFLDGAETSDEESEGGIIRDDDPRWWPDGIVPDSIKRKKKR